MATPFFGDCCCPTKQPYAEGWTLVNSGVSGQLAIRRKSFSQHLNFDQSHIDDQWEVLVDEMVDSSSNTFDATTNLDYRRLNLSTSQDTLWFDTGECRGNIDVTDPNSPTLIGCYKTENGAGGTEWFPESGPGFLGQLEFDNGISYRSCWDDSWFVFSRRYDHISHPSPNARQPTQIGFADPTNYVYRQDAYFDFSGGDWVPIGLCRSAWPAVVVGVKFTETYYAPPNDTMLEELVVEIGHATLPTTCPTNYPESITPTFTTVFTRTYTNNDATFSAAEGIRHLGREVKVADYDTGAGDTVWAIFAADDAAVNTGVPNPFALHHFYDDFTWKWTYSHAINGSTTLSVTQSHTAIRTQVNGATPGTETLADDDPTNAVRKLYSASSGIVGTTGGDAAYLGATLIDAGFLEDFGMQWHSNAYGSPTQDDVFTGNGSACKSRFVAVAADSESAKTSERWYYIAPPTVGVAGDATNFANDWAWSESTFSGGFSIGQVSISNLGASTSYILPGYKAPTSGSNVTKVEAYTSSLVNGDWEDVSVLSADNFVPDEEHVRQGD